MKVYIVEHGDSVHGLNIASAHQSLAGAAKAVPALYKSYHDRFGGHMAVSYPIREIDPITFKAGPYTAYIWPFSLQL